MKSYKIREGQFNQEKRLFIALAFHILIQECSLSKSI